MIPRLWRLAAMTAGPTRVTVTTHVKAGSEISRRSLSDEQLAPYRKLLEELRELAAAQEPKIRRNLHLDFLYRYLPKR